MLRDMAIHRLVSGAGNPQNSSTPGVDEIHFVRIPNVGKDCPRSTVKILFIELGIVQHGPVLFIQSLNPHVLPEDGSTTLSESLEQRSNIRELLSLIPTEMVDNILYADNCRHENTVNNFTC